MQALLVAGEEARDNVFTGVKAVSIRKGIRSYTPGEKIIVCCHILNWAVMKEVTSVRWTNLLSVTKKEYQADGFKTWNDMLAGLREFYPDINANDLVTIIRWKAI